MHHANLLFDSVGRDVLTWEHGIDSKLLDAMKENKAAGYLYDRRITVTSFFKLNEKQRAKLSALFKDGKRREFSVEV